MASKAVAARPELPATPAAQRLGRLAAPTAQIAWRVAGIEDAFVSLGEETGSSSENTQSSHP